VRFNGTPATISTASTTTLVVTVPGGATTGTISVTAPAGSATSSASFTITTGVGAPTITSFTPTLAQSATAVTISGTNFDTAIANDRLILNFGQVSASSATTTSLATSVQGSATS